MRKRLAKLPSPAMGVAFVALLAALTGTAVALPGSNTVTSGDIVNGQVKTQDIRNSTVRGRDVRNNTLTGSDVNEGSLGTVPSAGTANTANSARFAGASSFSGLSAETARLRRWNVSLGEGDASTVFSFGGITLEASCEDDGGNTELNYTLSGPSGFAAAGDDNDDASGADVLIEDPGADDAAAGDPDIQTSGYDATFIARAPGVGLTGSAASWADADDEVCQAWGHVLIS